MQVIPRHMELIWEINHRFLKLVRAQFPRDPTLPAALSIIEEPQPRPGQPGGAVGAPVAGAVYAPGPVAAVRPRLRLQRREREPAAPVILNTI